MLSEMKTDEREESRRLRRDHGLPIKEIARRVGVAPSSVSTWVRDVPLTPEQVDALRQRNPAYNAQLRGANRNAERGRERRYNWQQQGRAAARRGHALHVAGVMLYWGEGDKWSPYTTRISNSDPAILRVFLAFLRATFEIPDDRVRLTCHLFADHVRLQRQIEQHWLDALELPRMCLTKSVVNAYSRASTGKRRRSLPFGTCRLAVNSVHVTQHIYGAIQEYGGFDRPEWLG
jgi:transposase-like protein